MQHERFIVNSAQITGDNGLSDNVLIGGHVYAFNPRLRHPITLPSQASFITYKRAIFYPTLTLSNCWIFSVLGEKNRKTPVANDVEAGVVIRQLRARTCERFREDYVFIQ